MSDAAPEETSLTPDEAKALLASIPPRPRRDLGLSDHLRTAAIILSAFASGILAMAAQPWWAVFPALCAVFLMHRWVAGRLSRANEPRMKGTFLTTAVSVWLAIPIWRGIVYGETIPFPEAFVLAGIAPAAWLAFYIVLLVRR